MNTTLQTRSGFCAFLLARLSTSATFVLIFHSHREPEMISGYLNVNMANVVNLPLQTSDNNGPLCISANVLHLRENLLVLFSLKIPSPLD